MVDFGRNGQFTTTILHSTAGHSIGIRHEIINQGTKRDQLEQLRHSVKINVCRVEILELTSSKYKVRFNMKGLVGCNYFEIF